MESDATPKPPKIFEYRHPQSGLPRVYCNNVQMGTTSFDMRLLFGEVAEVLPDKIVVQQHVQVTMSWPEAKIIADFMLANIRAHEELNGAIQLPKNPEKVVIPETFPK